MNYEDTVKRAEKLRKDLNYYSYRYYVDNENDIDDYEYDMMMRELKANRGRISGAYNTGLPHTQSRRRSDKYV